MLVSAGLTLWWMRGTGFILDEMGFLVGRNEWDVHNLLVPSNGHLILTQMLLFNGSLSLFGADTHLPITLLSVAAQLAIGGLVYELARRRIGPLPALLPAVLVLFFGAGWEVMLNSAGLSNQIALIAGLGMLLCLERGDRNGDLGALALLTVAVCSHTLGLVFAVGAAVEILRGGGLASWRRLWIVAAPLVIYAVWWAWASQFHQTSTSAYAIGSIASGVYDQLAAILVSVGGIFRHPGSPDVGTSIPTVIMERGYALVLVLIAAVAARFHWGPRPSARTWAILAILAAYLVIVGLGLRDIRPPNASRYVYTGGVFALLLIVQLCDGLSIRRNWGIAAAVVTAIALIGNVAQMEDTGDFFRAETAFNRAELAALEQGRECIPPAYMPEEGIVSSLPHRDMGFTAREYFEAIDEIGSSPAYSPEELAAAPPEARAAAEVIAAACVKAAP